VVLPDGNVVAAGKTGAMYLLQQGNLGGNAPKNYVARTAIGPCWCTESYFVGSDGAGRVVSSGGNLTIQVWLEPSFALESQSPQVKRSGRFLHQRIVQRYGEPDRLGSRSAGRLEL
jgi:hypothetical protein